MPSIALCFMFMITVSYKNCAEDRYKTTHERDCKNNHSTAYSKSGIVKDAKKLQHFKIVRNMSFITQYP